MTGTECFLTGVAVGVALFVAAMFAVDSLIGKEIADEGQLPEDAGSSREADRGA